MSGFEQGGLLGALQGYRGPGNTQLAVRSPRNTSVGLTSGIAAEIQGDRGHLLPPGIFVGPYASVGTRQRADVVRTPRDACIAAGIPLALDLPNPRWLLGVTSFRLTVTNASTTLDMLAASIADQRFTLNYTTAAKPLAKIHCAAARIRAWVSQVETPAILGTLARTSVLKAQVGSITSKLVVERGWNFKSFNSGTAVGGSPLTTTATAPNIVESPWVLWPECPLVNMQTDQLSLDFDAAVAVSANLLVTVDILGLIVPNDEPTLASVSGAQCGIAGISAHPIEYSGALQASLTLNPRLQF